MADKTLNGMNEKELREYRVPQVHSIDDLVKIITGLVERDHDYGTAVYAMSISAVAAFNYVAHMEGVSGFQASCADLDIIGRIRHMKHGFKITNYHDLLYPQHINSKDQFPSVQDLLEDNKEMLAKEAKKLIDEKGGCDGCVHPAVLAWWQHLYQAGEEARKVWDEECDRKFNEKYPDGLPDSMASSCDASDGQQE